MRELTIRVKFTSPCLGSCRDKDSKDGRLVFARTRDDAIMFMASWHSQNMRLAAKLLGRHQKEVDKILWDVSVESSTPSYRWFRRYYAGRDGKRRFANHEAFMPGQVVSFNCVVPSTISDDDMVQLMNISGRYKGISPWKPGEYGRFEVESITNRRNTSNREEIETSDSL